MIRRVRRSPLFPVNVWPPFVDALTMVLAAFVLLMLVALAAQRGLLGRLRDRDQELTRLREDKARIERRLRALAPQSAIAVDDGKVILQGEVLFDTGSDALTPEGDALMADMGRSWPTCWRPSPTRWSWWAATPTTAPSTAPLPLELGAVAGPGPGRGPRA